MTTNSDLNPGTRFKQDLEVATSLGQILLNQQKIANQINRKHVDTKNFFGQILTSRIYTKNRRSRTQRKVSSVHLRPRLQSL